MRDAYLQAVPTAAGTLEKSPGKRLWICRLQNMYFLAHQGPKGIPVPLCTAIGVFYEFGADMHPPVFLIWRIGRAVGGQTFLINLEVSRSLSGGYRRRQLPTDPRQ
jgi:hypothetical protein